MRWWCGLSKAAALVVLLAIPVTAGALTLDEAKTKGWIGEKPDGYLGVVTGVPEAADLVRHTNELRRAEYANIARKNGTPILVVETLAGEKAIGRTSAGEFVMTPAGDWKQK